MPPPLPELPWQTSLAGQESAILRVQEEGLASHGAPRLERVGRCSVTLFATPGGRFSPVRRRPARDRMTPIAGILIEERLKKGTGLVVRSTLRAVPATSPVP